MTTALIVFPHHLFADHPGMDHSPDRLVLVEDPLFFGDPVYKTVPHKQRLWLHRATMARHADALRRAGHAVEIVRHVPDAGLIADLLARLAQEGVRRVVAADPVDDIALRRFRAGAGAAGLAPVLTGSPLYLNTRADNADWSAGRKRWFMADFYKSQRRRLDILMEGDAPAGGRWSFDEENRKKVPKRLLSELPDLPPVSRDRFDSEARESVLRDFPNAPGTIDDLIYPTSHADAAAWLDRFLADRFHLFGDYEDAIVRGETWLWHSVLTPMLNIGLLTPGQVIDAALAHADRHDVPLNSVEGFVRQIIGWREFIRATYEDLGPRMRTTNHWDHHRPLPRAFYDASTGIDPVDDTIRRVLRTGYCHHIERLMVLGGFMFLCEIDPDDVYRWFMEMFVDAYDWVMVPNVYGMSQNADGGLITTKPYFSGSNYIRKMSDWGTGDWATVWDGLYWRFIFKHRDRLRANPRWAMMCRSADRMDPAKRDAHLAVAEAFLARLWP